MDDLSDDIRRVSHQRIEVYAGGGRRRWPDELKAQIVAESFEDGAVVAEIARRHGCRPQQVHYWRHLARKGQLVLPAASDAPLLVPLMAESEPPAAGESCETGIVVEICEAVVRVQGRPGKAALGDVFAALRKARTC